MTSIHIIPAAQDPRNRHQTHARNESLPPQPLNRKDYPLLDLPFGRFRPASPKPGPIDRSWAEVVQWGVHRRSILDLPVEIREKIWKEVLEVTWDRSIGLVPVSESIMHNEQPDAPYFLPGLAAMSHATREEIIRTSVHHAEYLLSSVEEILFLRRFLRSISSLNCVRMLRVGSIAPLSKASPIVERRFYNEALDLAVDCRGLREIRLIFNMNDCYAYTRACTTDEFINMFSIRKLLECNCLRTIHFDCYLLGKEETELVQLVVEWIKNAFASKIPTHGVNCILSRRE